RPGRYRLEISADKFKTARVNSIEVIAGRSYSMTEKLEIGAAAQTVSVEAGSLPGMEKQNNTVEKTIAGGQILDLPYRSREAILMGALDPGAQTMGGPRNTAFEGLPKGSINITFDGINNQDNLLRSTDGFFPLRDGRIDDVQEFGLTTNAMQSSVNAAAGV